MASLKSNGLAAVTSVVLSKAPSVAVEKDDSVKSNDVGSSSGGRTNTTTAAAETSGGTGIEAENLRVAGKEGRQNTSDACRSATTCAACDEGKGCGWCGVRGMCVKGDAFGPLESDCAIWSFGACGGSRCGTLHRCGHCLADAHCGWCEARCTCMERGRRNPLEPTFGTCSKGWLLGEEPAAAEAAAQNTCPVAATTHCRSVEADAAQTKLDGIIEGLVAKKKKKR